MLVALKRCIFDPMLVEPKCVWKLADFFNFRKFVYIFQLFVYNFSNKLPPLKHILALPTWGQKCTVSELQAFAIPKFQVKHPVYAFVLLQKKAMLSMGWHDLNWHETAFDITHFSQFPTNAAVATAALTKAKRVLMETNESNIPQTKFNVWLFSKLLLIDVYIRKLHYWKTIWLLPNKIQNSTGEKGNEEAWF